jgi:hypothetical protein
MTPSSAWNFEQKSFGPTLGKPVARGGEYRHRRASPSPAHHLQNLHAIGGIHSPVVVSWLIFLATEDFYLPDTGAEDCVKDGVVVQGIIVAVFPRSDNKTSAIFADDPTKDLENNVLFSFRVVIEYQTNYVADIAIFGILCHLVPKTEKLSLQQNNKPIVLCGSVVGFQKLLEE